LSKEGFSPIEMRQGVAYPYSFACPPTQVPQMLANEEVDMPERSRKDQKGTLQHPIKSCVCVCPKMNVVCKLVWQRPRSHPDEPAALPRLVSSIRLPAQDPAVTSLLRRAAQQPHQTAARCKRER